MGSEPTKRDRERAPMPTRFGHSKRRQPWSPRPIGGDIAGMTGSQRTDQGGTDAGESRSGVTARRDDAGDAPGS
jgi:hypothetical protein